MRESRSNPNLRKQSKQPPAVVNYDESGLLQDHFHDPSFFQPMTEEPVLTRRLSQQPKTKSRASARQSLRKQPSARPSIANALQGPARELLPMQDMPAGPQWKGSNVRQISPPPHSLSRYPRQSVSPPPAVVTPPGESSDKKKYTKHSHRSKSTSKPNSRNSHRNSTSHKERSSSHDRYEVKDVEQKDLHPAVQEHILAEMQMAQQVQKEQEVYHRYQNHRQQSKQKPKQKLERETRRSRIQERSQGQPPEILHPYLQEHIMAENAIKETVKSREQQQREQALLHNARQQAGNDPNGMHEYLQEHFLATADREGQPFPPGNNTVDEQFASFAGNLLDAYHTDAVFGHDPNQDHQQLREERLRRHRDKKRNRKRGWFGRKSSHSPTGSTNTSISSTASGFVPPPAPPVASTPPPPSTAENTPKSIGSRLKSAVLPRRKQRESTRNDSRDAPKTINDPLLQQTILESIAASEAIQQAEPRAPPRSRSDLQHRSRRETEPRTSRRRRHSNDHDVEQRQIEQHDILESNMEQLHIGIVNTANGRKQVAMHQGVKLDSRRERQKQQPRHPEPQHPQHHAQHHQRERRRSSSQPHVVNRDGESSTSKNHQTPILDPELELAMMFASNTGEPNGTDQQAQQFLLEQQAALEALQRQQRERQAKTPPAPTPAAASRPPEPFTHNTSQLKPPPELTIPSTPHIDTNRIQRGEAKGGTGPTLKAAPEIAALPAPETDYCGNSWDGSRSTLSGEDEDFFDWASVDEEPPIREAVTRESFVSAITNPITSDGEYYSDSEPEDYYAENYDSDDYVDEDEWERLEKAMEKGGPEATRQWEEFLRKQSQVTESEQPDHEPMEANQHPAPYDGDYAPSQMPDSDEEDPVTQNEKAFPPQVAKTPSAQVAKAFSPQVAKAPPPQVAKAPAASLISVLPTFVCECCAERKSTKDHAHHCDSLGTPHMVCSGCIKKYLENRHTKYRMFESHNKTLYQVKCFTALDGSSCNGCNATLNFQLQSVFTLPELESWLVRERNRLHTMATAKNNRKSPTNY